ncbi:MAG TPA: response regulator [Kofleriaceae bacterium]|jgi:signal transduction histidine kinase|nr:response regulator [Kofleriaceae bacterium]
MTPPARILIVEDNRAVARDLEQRLGRLGFAIAGVTGLGEEAIVLSEDEHPDLVLMDIRLGAAMDGITAAEHIRARRGIPVVFLTMFADDATLRAASVTEAFGYIVKPAQDRELRIVIEMALYKHAAELDRRRLEEQLRRSEKMEAIGQLAGGIAHDFNNVLMAILSNCRSLRGQLPADQPPNRQLTQIEVAAERAAHLTRQLLAFGRDGADQPVALDLGAHVQRTASLLTQLIGDRIAIEIAIAPDLRAVLGRSSELEQVIMNLVLNARDAMPAGGTVTITARNAPAGEVELVVADTGQGMDEATRARVFEPFFTTKDVGEGTGLGLATVYAVVARARGRIDVASEPGKGTTFSIWLPATDAHAAAPPAPPPAYDDEIGPPIDATVVLVEDDDQVRGVIRDILDRAGLRVIEARDGHEALAACRSHPGVDLVLSDVVMPRLGGAELARTLAVDAPGTKVVYMSGYPNRGVPGGRSQDLGPVLQKPFTPGELLGCIRGALQSRAA